MATAQMFLALCVAGVAVAAPQLTLGLSRSATTGGANEQQVVSNVITALGPSINKAVADALAALNANSAAEEAAAAAEAARLEKIRLEEIRLEEIRIEEQRQQQFLIQQQQEQAARQQQIRLQEERRQQQIAAANAAAAAAALDKASFDAEVSADLGPHARPVYNFEYKVADEAAQTYISRNEERDGENLVGKYSFVDATGALVTVDYTAGPTGYAETRSKEDGFVAMRAQAPWTGPLAGVSDTTASGTTAARGSTSATGFASGSRTSSTSGGSRTSSTSGSRTSSTFGSSSRSGGSQSDLIARIIAALQPQISSAVTAALA